MATKFFLFTFVFVVLIVLSHSKSNDRTSLRIFCLIKTFGANLITRAPTIHRTWASRCDKHQFLTATNTSQLKNPSLPLLVLTDVADNYLELSVKVFDALNQIIRQKQPYDFDWIFIADDDTYVIMEHLRRILFHTSEPYAVGHLFAPKTSAPVHFSGGAGYAINSVALQRMLPDLQTTCSEWYIPGMEDVYVTRCLQHLNVTVDGAIDKKIINDHHRFYPLDFMTMYHMNFPNWFLDYNTLKPLAGFDCCSSETISFHYVSIQSMHLIDWARYLHSDDDDDDDDHEFSDRTNK